MEKIKIAVQGNRAVLLGSVDIIAGTVGQVCKFYFYDEWRSLRKNITYKIGSTIITSEEIKGDETVIPPNVLVAAGLPLEIGITGYASDKSIVIPTSWCPLGCIKNGANVRFGNGGGSGDDDGDDKHIIYDGGVIV